MGQPCRTPRRTILKRLHDFNCEWLQRPNIALSELAQTIRENLPLLQQYSGTIFMPEFVEDLASRMEPLQDVLSRLDNKDKRTSQPASREDVISLLRTIDGQPEVEDFAMEGLNAAGPLFMVCVHLLVPLTLMRNPEEFAEKARRTPQNASFKEDPSPCRMREFILNSITRRRRLTTSGSIWDSVDEPEEGQAEPPRRSQSHSRRRAQSSTPLPSLWEDDDRAVVDDQPETPARPSRSSNVSCKRRYRPTPPSSQEVYTQPDPLPGPSKWKRQAQPATSTPIPRQKAASRTGRSSPSSSELSSSSDEEMPQEKQPLQAAVKVTQRKQQPPAKPQPQAAAKKQAATKTQAAPKGKLSKKVCTSTSSSSSSSSDTSSDEAPAAKKTAAPSSTGKPSTGVSENKTSNGSGATKAKPKAKA